MGSWQVLLLQVNVDRGEMAMKSYYTFSKAPELESEDQTFLVAY